ncbi:MAG: hypothetical protein H6724_19050 [Sandaracinus sp.]|nr:hypothetical protein [Sandaracinus sp.]
MARALIRALTLALSLGAFSVASTRADVTCDVAIECASWTDLPELHAALHAEGPFTARLGLRACRGTTARLEVEWPEGARTRGVDLADVPVAARARTVALLFAELVQLGPQAPERIAVAVAPASNDGAAPGADVASENDGASEPSAIEGAAVEAAEPHEDASLSSESTLRANGSNDTAANGSNVAGANEPASNAANAPPANVSSANAPRAPMVEYRAGQLAEPHVVRARLALRADLGMRIFVRREHPWVPSAVLAVEWGWLAAGVELFGARYGSDFGDAGLLGALARVGLRTPAAGARVKVRGELFAEAGLVRAQGRANGDSVGGIQRDPAIGGGLACRVTFPLRDLFGLGLSLEGDILRGLVATAQRGFDTLPEEVVGAHGPSVRLGVQLTWR